MFIVQFDRTRNVFLQFCNQTDPSITRKREKTFLDEKKFKNVCKRHRTRATATTTVTQVLHKDLPLSSAATLTLIHSDGGLRDASKKRCGLLQLLKKKKCFSSPPRYSVTAGLHSVRHMKLRPRVDHLPSRTRILIIPVQATRAERCRWIRNLGSSVRDPARVPRGIRREWYSEG